MSSWGKRVPPETSSSGKGGGNRFVNEKASSNKFQKKFQNRKAKEMRHSKRKQCGNLKSAQFCPTLCSHHQTETAKLNPPEAFNTHRIFIRFKLHNMQQNWRTSNLRLMPCTRNIFQRCHKAMVAAMFQGKNCSNIRIPPLMCGTLGR